MTPNHSTSYRGGRAILDPGRAGRAKIKKARMKRSCGVQNLSNEPLPIALPALPADRLRSLLSLLYDDDSSSSTNNLVMTFIEILNQKPNPTRN